MQQTHIVQVAWNVKGTTLNELWKAFVDLTSLIRLVRQQDVEFKKKTYRKSFRHCRRYLEFKKRYIFIRNCGSKFIGRYAILQSFSPLQNSPLSTQFPSPQAKNPSWQSGSSVISRGFIFLSLFFNLQFFTASFQSQVCFSMSKYRPAGQRMACRPEVVHWITSRQLSLSPDTKRNHSPASLSLHNSFSKDSSFFSSFSCRFTRLADAVNGFDD